MALRPVRLALVAGLTAALSVSAVAPPSAQADSASTSRTAGPGLIAGALAPEPEGRDVPDGRTEPVGPLAVPSGAETDSLIVKYREDTTPSESLDVRREEHVAVTGKLDIIDAEVVRVPRGEDVEEVAERLEADPRVEYAVPDVRRRPATNDPHFGLQWGIANTGQVSKNADGRSQRGTLGLDLDTSDAWRFGRGRATTVVAVIDTGVDISHPDLAGAIWTNPGESGTDAQGRDKAANGVDDDRNGYVDDVHGWDFANGDNTVYDSEDLDEHGTHVAGTIAAVADNGIGVTGAAPGVKILPLKFLGPGAGRDSDAILAIQYAKAQGAKIINASWGSYSPGVGLREAIAASGAVFVAAAGNDGLDIDGARTAFYPAAYDLPNIVSVAAVDNRGALAGFSNYGARNVDVAAPGVSIYNTLPRRGEDIAAVEITDGAKRAAWWGFGLEDVTPATARRDLLAGALTHLQTPPSASVTLVLDDASASRVKTKELWGAALAAGGFTKVRTVSRDARDFVLPAPGASAVLWVTGDDYGNGFSAGPLTSTDRTGLSTFVRAGGRLLLAGPDAIYQSEDSALVTRDLHLRFVGEGDSRTTALGRASTAYAGTTLSLAGTDNYFRKPSPTRDVVQVTDPRFAVPSLVYKADAAGSQRYGAMDGTSMAAPHVAAVAALALSRIPSLNGGQLAQRVTTRTVPLASLTGKVRTGGLSSAAAAVVEAPSAATAVSASAGRGRVTASWRPPTANGGLAITGYDVTVSPGGQRKVLSASARSVTFADLRTGPAYSVTVRARNVGLYGPGARAAVYGVTMARTASASTVTYGAAVSHRLTLTRTGTRTVLGRQPVSLQTRRRGTTSWKAVCAVRTSSRGQATCSQKPAVSSEYRWTYNGGGRQLGGDSALLRVTVRPKVSAGVSSTSVRRGAVFTLSGGVGPKKAGQRIYLQRYDSGAWRNVTSTTLSSRSAYAFPVRHGSRATLRYRTVTRPDAYQGAGVSPTRTVRVS